MNSNVRFFSFRQGTLMLTPADNAKAMYKEALVPNQYDYVDLSTGLSSQLISPPKLFVADPSYPVVNLILTARWQILYDANFNGPSKLKFVAMGQGVAVATNWKTLNDVLFYIIPLAVPYPSRSPSRSICRLCPWTTRCI